MNYPDWAPSALVELHKRRLKNPDTTLDPDEHVARIRREHPELKDLPEEAFENLKKRLYRNIFSKPPSGQDTELLGKLLTDSRMKSVWISLKKRIDNPNRYNRFWNACQAGITGWLGSPRLTPKERQRFFTEIHTHAAELQGMMEETPEFDGYSITEFVDKNTARWMLEVLDANPPNISKPKATGNSDIHVETNDFSDAQLDYAMLTLSEVVPSIQQIISDIGKKALEYAQRDPIIKKPGSKNAAKHYFIRHLSSHLQAEYDQPLHNVVAITTSVVFDSEIDEDHVRKIVQ